MRSAAAPDCVGAAASEHRGGPIALAIGAALAFTAAGLLIATVGFALGLDGDMVRSVAAFLMIGVGVLLAIPRLQMKLVRAGGPVSNWANRLSQRVDPRGVTGQFGIGVLLGAAWSPCVGPTLGAASMLAAQGSSLTQVGATMLAFGAGAVAPFAAIGFVSRQAIGRWRDRLIIGGKGARTVLGILLILLGLLAVSGLDKRLEAILIAQSPQWLTDMTTRF